MTLTPLCDQAITNFFKSNNQTIKNFITDHLACENIRFSSLFAAGDETSPAAKSEEKRVFSQATDHLKWTPHGWEGAGKHLRAKHDGLKSHPPGQSPLLSWPVGCSLVLINDHWSASENSELVLKIYMVEFEIESVCGKMRRVLA